MINAEVEKIIMHLRNDEISIFDIPEEYQDNIHIVNVERELGMRKSGKRGFDVISNSFFVEEELIYQNLYDEEERRKKFISFGNFESYFKFLDGDIYDDACYAFCPLFDNEKNLKSIDFAKINNRKSFVDRTVDDYTFLLSKEEEEIYNKGKQRKGQCKRWIEKFNNCTSYDDLVKVVKNYSKSKLSSIVDVTFFFFQYIFADVKNEERFSIIMEYMSSGDYPEYNLINALCSIYDPDEVFQRFDYSAGSKATIYKNKKKLKDYIRNLKNDEIVFYTNSFFDERTHYFCEEVKGYTKDEKRYSITTIKRYFETFDDFIDYRKGNLINCDLSSAIECNVDFNEYLIDDTTKLPINQYVKLDYSIIKYYENNSFYVEQKWHDKFGNLIKEYSHSFDYFFDFVAFLKGDLSEADLLLCDGLINLQSWDEINFNKSKIRSTLCDKFGLEYDDEEIKAELIKSFTLTEQNEKETGLALQISRNLFEEAERMELDKLDVVFEYKCQRINYISDIHLMHRIKKAGCRSKEDVIYVVKRITDNIANEAGNLLLISGDIASEFSIFQLFVNYLSKKLHHKTIVVFTLGNHELWSFPGESINQIVAKYRLLLEEEGMYLLHNDILYIEDKNILDDPNSAAHIIYYHDLCKMNEKEISDRVRSARTVILGGIGFSGYNMEFNADNGIYLNTIDRATEIKETKRFEELYLSLSPILSNKNTIILTHTPKKDWCRKAQPDKNYVYVSGHTHSNFFHDDGEYRVYSDNQIGYYNDAVHLKTFLIDNEYDCFFDYDNGIYEITSQQYNDFYRGKNLAMTFKRNVNILYMLKKNDYYSFIHKSKNGSFTILNGGAMKKLDIQDIQYFYDKMDSMISLIESPLDKFTAFQKSIANIIKKIGGEGKIHGCIIDIDFYNHIYVNPNDLSITGYFATDIINKVVYPSILNLLQENCPEMLSKYNKLLDGNLENAVVLKQQTVLEKSPQIYLDTDIYKASREIRKMQKLNSNILCSWYEDVLNNNSGKKLLKD